MSTPADRWIDAWFRAWTEHDPEALAPVYAAGPVQRSEPFRERQEPQLYAAWAFSDETGAEVWFRSPGAEGGDSAACEWWAISRDGAGEAVTLAGVSLLRFDAAGRVVDQRDYWSQHAGARQPPEDWLPAAKHGSTR